MASNVIPFPRRAANDNPPPPADPTGVGAFALLYRRLGGSFTMIDGKLWFGKPEAWTFEGDLPQIDSAEPHERFQSDAEWKGAMKLIEAIIVRSDVREAA